MIIASVLTHNNESGLNALLWCIYFQTHSPDRIVITNTGKPLLSKQITCTINFISQKIPIEMRSVSNTVSFGMLKYLFFDKMHDDDLVWMLEDDLVFDPDLLNDQYDCSLPNVPMYLEQGMEYDPKEQYTCAQFKGTSDTIILGNIYGMLVQVKDFRTKVKDLDKYFISSDYRMTSDLRPSLVRHNIIHTKPKEFTTAIYALQEKFFIGEIKPCES